MQPGVHPRLGHALEESLRRAPPTPRRPMAPGGGRPRSEKEGHAGGLGRSTGLHVGGERPLERIGRLIGLARPPGGLAHQLEVLGRQASLAIGRGECLQRLRPGVAFEGVPA